MSTIRITKKFHFEAAHALAGYDGPCSNIHGHSYELSLTVLGKPIDQPDSPKHGMVLDFKELKQIVTNHIIDLFDHSLILSRQSSKELIPSRESPFGKMVIVDYQPTSENLLLDFVARLKQLLPPGIKLHNMILKETGTSTAEWHADDNPDQ